MALDVGGHRALGVLAGDRGDELGALLAQAGGQRLRAAVVDRALHGRDPRPWAGAPGARRRPARGRRAGRARSHSSTRPSAWALSGASGSPSRHEPQRPSRSEQPRQPLGAAAPGREAEQDLGLADRRTVASAISRTSQASASSQPPPIAEPLIAATNTAPARLKRSSTSPKRSAASRPAAGVRASASDPPGRRRRPPTARQRGARRRPADARRGARGGEQLADVVVGDEALRMRAGEHDAGDVGIGLRPLDQPLQAVDHAVVHEPVRRVLDRREHDAVAGRFDSHLAHRRRTLSDPARGEDAGAAAAYRVGGERDDHRRARRRGARVRPLGPRAAGRGPGRRGRDRAARRGAVTRRGVRRAVPRQGRRAGRRSAGGRADRARGDRRPRRSRRHLRLARVLRRHPVARGRRADAEGPRALGGDRDGAAVLRAGVERGRRRAGRRSCSPPTSSSAGAIT